MWRRHYLRHYVPFWPRQSCRGVVARELLSSYVVELAQRNGYDAYEQFERMKSITCSAVCSCEVKVTEALDENMALTTQVLCHISKLYKVESEVDKSGISIEEDKEKCIQESHPVILIFEKWMQDAYLKLLPKSSTRKAIRYAFEWKHCSST